MRENPNLINMGKIFKLISAFVFLATTIAISQSEFLPHYAAFSYHEYSLLYSETTGVHSAIKPLLLDKNLSDFFRKGRHSLSDSTSSWLYRKIFSEHLIDINKKDYEIILDVYPDLLLGRDLGIGRFTWMNTRGINFQSSIGDELFFSSSFFENQAVFPKYIDTQIRQDSVVPGQGQANLYGSNGFDWRYSSAFASYNASGAVNLLLAYDKQFIGDGYRSVLLSDISANYPFFRLTLSIDPIKYTSTWAQLTELNAPKLSYFQGYRKKWAVFHYLDWKVSKSISLGLFEAMISADADSGGKNGLEFSYINPILFLRPVDGNNGSPDNALLGLDFRYNIMNGLVLYSQLLIDEFTAKEVFANRDYWGNKYAYQVGIRGIKEYDKKYLTYLLEFNSARPYTYSESDPIISYGHFDQPLAHPLGSNFNELIIISDYKFGNYLTSIKINISAHGVDTSNSNYGNDIFKSYSTRISDYGIYTNQGLNINSIFLDASISYILNPLINLRIEGGVIFHHQKNPILGNEQDFCFYLGLRSSFRNLSMDY
jgi:hypothetical protein